MASSRNTALSTKTDKQPAVSRRLVVGLVIGYLVLVFFASTWVLGQIDKSTRRLCQRALQAILDGNTARLQLYVSDLQIISDQLAKTPEVEQLARSEPPSDPRWRDQFPDRPDAAGWIVTDSGGKIVAADDERRLSHNCPWTREGLQKLQGGSPAIVLPDYDPASFSLGCMFIVSPIMSKTDRFAFLGSVGWIVDPREELSDQFSTGATDGTCMFDRQGRLLTRSRFEDQLPAHQRPNASLPARPWYPTLLKVPAFDARQSGLNLSPEKLADRPLTRMADRATRGSAGFDTDGYEDYRGVPVLGVWRWMPELGVGLGMEIDTDEALYAMTMVKWLIGGMFSLLTIAGLCVAALAVLSGRLRQRLSDWDQDVRRLGQYELTELLGVGGMGAVYRGKHQFLRRDVAIKVLEGEMLSPQSITRFRREVQLTSNLRHPNTIAIYDYGQAENLERFDQFAGSGSAARGNSSKSDMKVLQENGVFYYVMEYIDGITLQQLIDYYGPQSPERTVHLLRQICGSIAEAHAAGLIHRDIKPANILLSAKSTTYDHIKVLDFGLVKELNKDEETIAITMTRSDSMTGTPLYMAPETIRDATQSSPAGDLYSIGAVGYALLTGKPTYEGESAIDLCLKQLERPPVSPEVRLGNTLPQGLQDCIMKCLSREAEDRPGSVNQLLETLDSLPEASAWNQTDSIHWWDNVFEGNRQQTPVEAKAGTVADRPLKGVS